MAASTPLPAPGPWGPRPLFTAFLPGQSLPPSPHSLPQLGTPSGLQPPTHGPREGDIRRVLCPRSCLGWGPPGLSPVPGTEGTGSWESHQQRARAGQGPGSLGPAWAAGVWLQTGGALFSQAPWPRTPDNPCWPLAPPALGLPQPCSLRPHWPAWSWGAGLGGGLGARLQGRGPGKARPAMMCGRGPPAPHIHLR